MALRIAWMPFKLATFTLLVGWLADMLCNAPQAYSCTPATASCASIALMMTPTAPRPVSLRRWSGSSASCCNSLHPSSCTTATASCSFMASTTVSTPSCCTISAAWPFSAARASTLQPLSCKITSFRLSCMAATTICKVMVGRAAANSCSSPFTMASSLSLWNFCPTCSDSAALALAWASKSVVLPLALTYLLELQAPMATRESPPRPGCNDPPGLVDWLLLGVSL
mmetsp:Transcript_11551/g.24297  ORF Transcript_11551/g.24297 Transcript_11551/m.24297 type:complete len:226 (+) Transcript_11551:633-1310(+)